MKRMNKELEKANEATANRLKKDLALQEV